MRTLRYRYRLSAILLTLPVTFLHAADGFKPQQEEEFLSKAKIRQSKDAKKGTTGTLRVTLTDGAFTHDASVQTIDESKQFFLNEIGFKDSTNSTSQAGSWRGW